MSYAAERSESAGINEPAAQDEGAEVMEREAVPFDDGEVVTLPLAQLLTLDGGYSGAVLSLAGDPLAPNAAERIKTVLIVATEPELLGPRITAALIDQFDLSQEEAESVVPVQLEEAAPPVEPQPPTDPPGEEPEVSPPEDTPQREA